METVTSNDITRIQMEKCNRDRMTRQPGRLSQLFLTGNNDQIISNGLIYCGFFSGLVMSLDSPDNKAINMPLTSEKSLTDIYLFINKYS